MPILDPHSLEFISRSVEQTRRVGMRLGAMLRPVDVISLEGDLGSGKTTFVQGIAAGWGSADVVTSPTFVLVNIYRRPDGERIYHLDAYRLSSPGEAIALDLEAMLESGPMLVEWAERIRAALPAEYLWVAMRYIDIEQRDLIFAARGTRYQALLKRFSKRLYGIS